MNEAMNVLFFGVGAVGASVGAWVASNHENTYFYDKPEILDAISEKGLRYYEQGNERHPQKVDVKVVKDLKDAPEPDIIVVCVKNYSLDGVSKFIVDTFGDGTIIVGLQNGRDNQDILPKYFEKPVFGVVCYNAWLDEPGQVGYQKHGPLVLGSLEEEPGFEVRAVARIFNKGVETIITPHLQDAVHSKMVINLTNSLTTLVGHKFREISDPAIFQKLLSNLTFEGVQIIKAAGYKECKLGGMPSFLMLEASVKLPRFITKGMFEKNVKKMVVSSMAQDILQRGGTDSELESLNGYFIDLADEYGVEAPYNRTVYDLCREKFGKPGFEPMDVKEVYEEIQKRM